MVDFGLLVESVEVCKSNIDWATANARRVLPIPPGPTMVIRRAAGLARYWVSSTISAVRPKKGVSWAGRLLRRCAWIGCASGRTWGVGVERAKLTKLEWDVTATSNPCA